MKYTAQCTHCISLLKNIKKYANAKYFIKDGECYIEIDDNAERIYIEYIETHQAITLKYYKKLLDYNEIENK